MAVVVLTATGCGSDDTTSATVVQQPTTGPEATVPTTTTVTPTTSTSTSNSTNPTATTGVPPGGVKPTTTGGAPAGGEQGEGGAGDEEAVRVPVTLAADGGSLSPTVVTIPAFLAIELRVSAKGGAEKLTISAPGGGTLSVAAGRTATKRLAGLKPGDYPVTTAGGGKATLHVVSGGDPGP
ncbi:MAG TPA: hypothetical protein VFY45_25795 [Baekduia sp.]|nr:hypothetical protein [Baekduia sp.]